MLQSVNWKVDSAVAVLLGDAAPTPSDGLGSPPGRVNRSRSMEAPPGKRKLKFKVPPNVKSGATVTIEDGVSKKKFNVKIPPGATPGSTLQVLVDE